MDDVACSMGGRRGGATRRAIIQQTLERVDITQLRVSHSLNRVYELGRHLGHFIIITYVHFHLHQKRLPLS
jgi:hypothetical protein